jgi:hypothetical protein
MINWREPPERFFGPTEEIFAPIYFGTRNLWEIYGQVFKSTVKNGHFWAESTVKLF